MKKILVLVLLLSLMDMGGCSKKEKAEGAGEPRGNSGVVSTEPLRTSSNALRETATSPKLLAGEIGSTSSWGSGWLDLATVTDFAAGDVLLLQIGGTAKKVIVRLLPEGKFPDSTIGIVGGAVAVPGNRIVKVVLSEDRKGII